MYGARSMSLFRVLQNIVASVILYHIVKINLDHNVVTIPGIITVVAFHTIVAF
jgi:hypothetical protein